MASAIFEFVDGTREVVWPGSPRYRELLQDGHAPVGSVPEPDGVSDQLEAFLAERFGDSVDTTDAAVALALSEGEAAPGVMADAIASEVAVQVAADPAVADAAAVAVAGAAGVLPLAQYVRHGYEPNTVRPADARMVIWVGATRPTNMTVTDLWVENTAGPYPIKDDFNRADAATLGSTDTGQAWTSGTWTIVSNQAKVTGTGVAFFDAGYADAELKAKIISHGSGTVGLVFRYVDSQNYFGVTNTKVFKRVGNVLTDLSATFTGGATLGINDTCKVVAVGTSIKVYKDAGTTGTFTLIGDYTDSDLLTATKHGLRSANANGIVDTYRADPL